HMSIIITGKSSSSSSPSLSPSLWMTMSRCYHRPHLCALIIAGFANNFKDGVAWGIFPTFYHQQQISLTHSSYLLSAYPLVWGVGQLLTGTASDIYGRKRLIVLGLLCQSIALLLMYLTTSISYPPLLPQLYRSFFSPSYLSHLCGSLLLGLG